MPQPVIARAAQVLQMLTTESVTMSNVTPVVYTPAIGVESSVQQELEALKKYKNIVDGIDYDTLSPKKAFDILWNLKQ